MEFTVDKNVVEGALNLVSKGVPSRSPRPIMQMIRVEAKKGKVYLRGTNSVVDITTWLDAEVKVEGACCVHVLLANSLGGFGAGDVRFRLGKQLSLSQGKGKNRRLAVADITEFPNPPEIKGEYTDEGVDALLASLTLANVAVSDRADMPSTRGLYINPHTSSVIATDGNQVFLNEGVEVDGDMALPSGAYIEALLSELKSAENLKMNIGHPWVSFKAANFIISVNSEENPNKFPDIALLMKPYLEVDGDDLARPPKLIVQANSGAIRSILEDASMISNVASKAGRFHHLAIERKNGDVRFQMAAQDIGGLDDILECEAEGVEEYRILVHPVLLKEYFDLPLGDEVEMRFYRPEDPFIIVEPDKNYHYLQVAMNLDEEALKVAESLVEEGVEVPVEPEPVLEEEGDDDDY